MDLHCEVLSWGEVYTLSKKMSLNVKKNGYQPDVVVAISRGGVIPARILCDVLSVMDLLTLKVNHWLQTGEHTEKAIVKYPLNADFSAKRVLVVDDITDTGGSLEAAVEHLSKLKPKTIKTATMQYIPTSSFKPDYTGKVVSDWAWFIFPWNMYEDLGNLTLRLLKNHPEKRGDSKDLAKWFRQYYGIRVSSKKIRETALMLSEKGLAKWEDKKLVPLRS